MLEKTLNDEINHKYEDHIFPNPSQYGLQFHGFGLPQKVAEPVAKVETAPQVETKTRPEPNPKNAPQHNVETQQANPNISFEELRKKLDISFQSGESKTNQKTQDTEIKEVEHQLGFNFLESWNDYFNQVQDSFIINDEALKSLSRQDQYKGGKVSVLFLGDTYSPQKYGDEEDMLAKMIQAMKLGLDEYCRLYYDPDFPEEQYFHAFFQEISLFQPDYVVCMGATITNLLLRKQNRLTKVHGNFYPIKLVDQNSQSVSFQMIPIFHPEYLKVNPSMKKNTWEDLQKLMKQLGKC